MLKANYSYKWYRSGEEIKTIEVKDELLLELPFDGKKYHCEANKNNSRPLKSNNFWCKFHYNVIIIYF